uniref:Uncharacterized protein n=1 Tax=Anguilla anguilla TaxID=7936 RepID=A0A0E9U3K0_ANGAN
MVIQYLEFTFWESKLNCRCLLMEVPYN